MVNNATDTRWRVFDSNSRQVTEGDIYNVAEVLVIQKGITSKALILVYSANKGSILESH